MSTLYAIPDITLADLPVRLRKRTTIDDLSGCWTVGGYNDDDGYAYYAGRPAARWAWETFVAPIPAGHQMDHVRLRGCVHRNCIWLPHLEPVTPRVNTMRGSSFAVANAAKTECGACGTPYDKANTYEHRGRRDCRNCNKAAVKRYKERLKVKAALAALPGTELVAVKYGTDGTLFDFPMVA